MDETSTQRLLERLQSRLRLDGRDTSELEDVLNYAMTLVTDYAGKDTPQGIIELAVLEVAADLWAKRDARGGILDSPFEGGAPTRLARDPLTAAYPILDRFRGIVFA